MEKKKPNPIFTALGFAGEKKSSFLLSVLIAICGSACSILPYFVMAGIVQDLLSGNRDFGNYLWPCIYMAILWGLRVLFHGISTTFSHKATFAVLGNIRKQSLHKLQNMPLGDVQRMGSGSLKNTPV